MTSIFPAQTPRKRSKNDLKQVEQEQQKIGAMVRGFYERTRTKLVKSLTKCENRNSLLCRELFQSLTMHPNQELYETVRLHDVIFNELDVITQTITEFIRKMDGLHQKLRNELALQQERSTAKREKGLLGENSIAVLRKVSFKRENHAFKHRLLALDTINKKVMKCEAGREQGSNGFHLDIEGRKTEPVILAYSKIWFESKRREYLLCLGLQGKLHIFNDKLQTIAVFPSPVDALNPPLSFLQVGYHLYFVTSHQVTRISLLNQLQTFSKLFKQKILRAESYMGGVLLWVFDVDRQHRILFLDEELQMYYMSELKMNVACIVSHFTIEETVFFLTATQNGFTEILKIDQFQTVFVGEVSPVEETIPVSNDNKIEEVILRLGGNRFVKLSRKGGLVGLEVQIEQGQSIRSCAILGQHFYALSENGKSMLECHYPVSL